jgi:hypothetical protein
VHWFIVDETNKNPVSGQFFIIGGLVFREDQIEKVHSAIELTRIRRGYRPGDKLKFQSSARPAHVTIENALAAKQEVIATLRAHGVRMLTYVLLHDVGAKQSEQARMEMGLNTIAWAYYRLLAMENAWGCMMIDRDDKQHAHLVTLFQEGVGSASKRSMADRIKFYGMTSDNASHLSSAVDIALGGFRFCVNAAGKDSVSDTGQVTVQNIFQPLSELLWGVEVGEKRHIGGFGYIERPQSVRAHTYREKYNNLKQKLEAYSGSTAATADGDDEP